MPLQLPRANAKQVDGKASQDLTAHPWAGLKVRMTLAARDQAGQTGTSQPYEFILPERKFTKPLAKAVVEQRKKLVRERDAADRGRARLDALTLGGEQGDRGQRRSISPCATPIGGSRPTGRAQAIAQRRRPIVGRGAEDRGRRPAGGRARRQGGAGPAVQALKENASPEEIERLVDELRSALSRYLQAMAEQAQQKGNLPAAGEPERRSARLPAGSRQDAEQHREAGQVRVEGSRRAHAERAQGRSRPAADRQPSPTTPSSSAPPR